MPYRHFASYNIVGAFLWGAGITLLGFFLGHAIPSVDTYLLPVIALILFISILPSAYHIWKENGAQIKSFTRTEFREMFRKGKPEPPVVNNEQVD